METQAFAAVRRMFPRERNDQAPSNIHAVDEARDSETVEPSPQDEPQLSLFQ
jgi:hypothetical protein